MVENSRFEAVAKVEEVPEEGTFGVVKTTGEPVCLIRHAGRITAVADNCTHREFAMSLGDGPAISEAWVPAEEMEA
jgi:nitrite reductase/ring-hydroxylating ferredoxin subunit